jgi:RNA polymerase sigma factor (sigma-70 family)
MDNEGRDRFLVSECLAGSEAAWREFYARFVGLIRSVVRRHSTLTADDIEDVVQAAFLSLTTALRNFDPDQSLPRFVCLVTDRVLIDEYRKGRAAKRDGEVDIPGDSDTVDSIISAVPAEDALQDERVEKAEQAVRLKAAMDGLDPRCQRLITLRFIDELSFKEIAHAFDQTENTVTVQTRRCLDSLRERFLNPRRRGRTP